MLHPFTIIYLGICAVLFFLLALNAFREITGPCCEWQDWANFIIAAVMTVASVALGLFHLAS